MPEPVEVLVAAYQVQYVVYRKGNAIKFGDPTQPVYYNFETGIVRALLVVVTAVQSKR